MGDGDQVLFADIRDAPDAPDAPDAQTTDQTGTFNEIELGIAGVRTVDRSSCDIFKAVVRKSKKDKGPVMEYGRDVAAGRQNDACELSLVLALSRRGIHPRVFCVNRHGMIVMRRHMPLSNYFERVRNMTRIASDQDIVWSEHRERMRKFAMSLTEKLYRLTMTYGLAPLDIKQENLLIADDDEAWLIDFDPTLVIYMTEGVLYDKDRKEVRRRLSLGDRTNSDVLLRSVAQLLFDLSLLLLLGHFDHRGGRVSEYLADELRPHLMLRPEIVKQLLTTNEKIRNEFMFVWNHYFVDISFDAFLEKKHEGRTHGYDSDMRDVTWIPYAFDLQAPFCRETQRLSPESRQDLDSFSSELNFGPGRDALYSEECPRRVTPENLYRECNMEYEESASSARNRGKQTVPAMPAIPDFFTAAEKRKVSSGSGDRVFLTARSHSSKPSRGKLVSSRSKKRRRLS